jgi:hypothetical protein
MNRRTLQSGLLMLAVLGAGLAEARQWRYAGLHPRTGHPQGGLCHIQAVHVHAGAPAQGELLYRAIDGVHIFIGDPTPFGYDGPSHAFYGHHPVQVSAIVPVLEAPEVLEFCYLDGPHTHVYAPPPDHPFDEQEEVHYFTGEYPPVYVEHRPRLERVNRLYKPWKHARPVVTHAPPAAYLGPVVQISVGLPTVGIHVGPVLPAVIVVDDHHPGHGRHKHGKYKKAKHRKHKGRGD